MHQGPFAPGNVPTLVLIFKTCKLACLDATALHHASPYEGCFARGQMGHLEQVIGILTLVSIHLGVATCIYSGILPIQLGEHVTGGDTSCHSRQMMSGNTWTGVRCASQQAACAMGTGCVLCESFINTYDYVSAT